MAVVSASRRCDIPARRMPWLMERLREGACEVRNPFDARRVRTVSLAPDDVDCLALWTRDPAPIAARARELEALGYRFYAQVTLTGYPASLEPGVPSPGDALAAFAALAGAAGPERALWRYDPIIVSRELTPDWHLRNFESLAAALEGRSRRVTLSLVDEYARTRSRLERAGLAALVFGSPRPAGPGARGHAAPPALPVAPYPELLAGLAAIARSRGLTPVSCAEPYDLSGLGIERGACIDAALMQTLFGIDVGSGKDAGQRKACGCAPSVDIGEYGSCPAGCAYCYARR